MPNKNTFQIKPIKNLLLKIIKQQDIIIDPFARNSTWTEYSNGLNPMTSAKYHLQANDFCDYLYSQNIIADVILFDPPYSPRQISECYKAAGLTASMRDTQNARFYKEIRIALDKLLKPKGITISFGWNSVRFGKNYIIEEILLVSQGAHNDTICTVCKKLEYILD